MEHYKDAYRSCHLCPRACGVDRTLGRTGYCRMPATVYAARAALHMWEEPCISGEQGSGAVFFSGCTLGCVFCQNHEIARGLSGKEISAGKLSDIFLDLQAKGANNINLVTPDHFAPDIAEAARLAREKGLTLPFVCNCSAYMSETAFDIFKDFIDIWLPDFKYVSPAIAGRYANAPDYPAAAKKALLAMYRQCGDPVFDDEGMMRRGMIVRHLLLPGCLEDSKAVIRDLYETFGDHIYISIMNQFTPIAASLTRFPELNRQVTEAEYEALVDYAIDLGVENGFIQEGSTVSESFIPAFDNTGI